MQEEPRPRPGFFFRAGAPRFCEIEEVFTPAVAPSTDGAPRWCAVVRNICVIEEESFDGGEILYVVSPMSFDGDERFIVIAQQSGGVEENFFGVKENSGAIGEDFFFMALENSAGALLWFDLSQTNGVIVVRRVCDIKRRFYC